MGSRTSIRHLPEGSYLVNRLTQLEENDPDVNLDMFEIGKVIRDRHAAIDATCVYDRGWLVPADLWEDFLWGNEPIVNVICLPDTPEYDQVVAFMTAVMLGEPPLFMLEALCDA